MTDQPYTLVATNLQTGEPFFFSVGSSPTMVGRSTPEDEPSKFRLDCDPSLSRSHCAVRMVGDRLHVWKVHAKIPIYLRGQPQEDFHIQPGDEFVTGQLLFELKRPGGSVENPTRQLALTAVAQESALEHDAARCLRALLGLQPLFTTMPEPRTMFGALLPLIADIVSGASEFCAIQVQTDRNPEILGWHGQMGSAPPLSRTLIRQAIGERTPIVYFWGDSVRRKQAPTASAGVTWALAAPIISGTEMYALYAVGKQPRPSVGDGPTEVDRAVIALIAQVVAQYLEGRRAARLEIEVEYEHEQRRLSETLRDLILSLTSTLHMTEVMERLLENLERVVRFDRAVVLATEPDGLRTMGSRGYAAGEAPVLHVRLDEPFLLQMDANRRPMNPDSARFSPWYGDLAEMPVWIAVPLVSNKLLAGVLFLGRRGPDQFTEAESNVASMCAGQAGIAIQNAGLYQEMRRLASTDELTGAFNRRYFFYMGQERFATASRTGAPLCVICFDVDHFKQFNDSYGHDIGDQVLRQVAARCRRVLEDEDTFGRCGGEEFAILLRGSAESAMRLADQVRVSIGGEPVRTERGPVTVTVSLGVACTGSDTPSFMTLLKHADDALYLSKTEGRNRAWLYSPNMVGSDGSASPGSVPARSLEERLAASEMRVRELEQLLSSSEEKTA